MCFYFTTNMSRSRVIRKEIIQIKELLVQYKVEEYVLHLLENEIIRIGIVMGDLQKEL